MLLTVEVLSNLIQNGNFDSVSLELEADNFLVLKHTAVGFVHERAISLDALPTYLPDREAEILKWVMEVNVWAEASLVQQAMPASTVIH